ncbi:hypothetical protein EVAR_91108_1 [Eumeta japonica]|uniref:Uncharacterized protein n=1 Tax=Eumeta variegata TaxID=151549 RepID=A0A4C1SQ45_EUMVA|nr:hypothetical protein EVAR_91108_1 [Eumeta japonica]
MSSEDKRNLTWAKAYIAETSNSLSAVLKQHLKDSALETMFTRLLLCKVGKPRRGSTITNRPFSEVAKDPLVRALVDRSNADGAITMPMGLINQRLLDSYLKATG